jgi:hypothetical protein
VPPPIVFLVLDGVEGAEAVLFTSAFKISLSSTTAARESKDLQVLSHCLNIF